MTSKAFYNNKLRNGEVTVPVGMKYCAYCDEVKLKNKFGPHKKNKDGLAGHCRSCKNEQQKQYQKKNKEKVNANVRAWSKTEKGKENYKRKIANNPELYRMMNVKKSQTRRARVRNAFVEPIDPQIVYERDEGICGICLEPVSHQRFDIDHIFPLALGGTHQYENVQLAHFSCNRSKAATLLGVRLLDH